CLTLVAELEQSFHEKLAAYQKTNRYLFVAQIISSGIEACDKLHRHFESVRKCVDQLNNLRRVQDIPWVEVDWKELHERIDQVYRRLMLSAAQILPPLGELPA